MPRIGAAPSAPRSALLPQGRDLQPGLDPLSGQWDGPWLGDPAQPPAGAPAAPNRKGKLHVYVTFKFGRQSTEKGG